MILIEQTETKILFLGRGLFLLLGGFLLGLLLQVPHTRSN